MKFNKLNDLNYLATKFSELNKLEKSIVVIAALIIYPGLPLLSDAFAKPYVVDTGMDYEQIQEAEASLRREIMLKKNGYMLIDPITGKEVDKY